MKFAPGQFNLSRAAYDTLSIEEVVGAFRRHLRGDWGDLSAEDKAANEAALREGGRLLSAYTTKGGIKFWIVTEADREYTTVILPKDY